MKKFCFVIMTGLMMLLPIQLEASAQWFMFQNPLLGKEAPNFKLKNLSGQERELSQLRDGQPAIIFFWTTWCPHCLTQLEELKEGSQEITQKGISIILVDLGEDPQKIQRYVDKQNIDFEILVDEAGLVAEEYGVQGIPTFVYISESGKVSAVEHEIVSNYEEILFN